MTPKHGGNLNQLAAEAGLPVEDVIDFSASINPLGPPEWFRAVISRGLTDIVHYPDPVSADLVQTIAETFHVRPEEVIVGNGSSEIFSFIPRAVSAARAVIPVPAYSEYESSARLCGLPVETLSLSEANGFALDLDALGCILRKDDLVYLGQPNNPTGLPFDAGSFEQLAANHPETTFVVDEAFAGFVKGSRSLVQGRLANVIVVRSLTKFYAVPGLRLGFAVAEPRLAERLRELLPPWSVNSLAQAFGKAALRDEAYRKRTLEVVARESEWLSNELSSLPGLHVSPGAANFLLARIDRPGLDAPALAVKLLEKGVAIRVCDNFSGLDRRFFRVAVKTRQENERLCRALAAVCGLSRKPRRPQTPAIMFQGTSSNAGKSVLAAAFCRILLQDGYRVAPFKAQNMSLNSFVTRDGGEMGRAQVMQAQACRHEPEVRMNPILLKPNSDTGAQVILQGQPVGNMNVDTYTSYKSETFKTVQDAYDSLSSEHDAMVLEGAGSPAEVNLKHHDIVNMRMAEHASAPVLLVGDIDRGGVFASFVGTMEVLAEWERALIAGFVVNRFRGDESLLGSAFETVYRHTGRSVFGVVPFLRDLNLPEEDSVEFKSGALDHTCPAEDAVEIAVIDLPHISNFTDFDAFRAEPDVQLNIVRSPADLKQPDVVILPGSKNVIGDLEYLRRGGLADRIALLAEQGRTEVVGICAGLQMLGQEISDPHHIECSDGKAPGLGLLPASTVLAREKTLTRADGTHIASRLPVHGYEIHHGQTAMDGAVPLIETSDSRVVGVSSRQGSTWGTYLHGVFDADDFRRWFIDRIRERSGKQRLGRNAAVYDLEPAFDRLADTVRASLDINRIYELMRLP